MFHLRYALAASVACLACGVAAAQDTLPSRPPSNSAPAAADRAASAPFTQTDNATPAVSAGVNTSVTVDANGARRVLISNPPVPDTRENRAKYGSPLSNAGRHTRATGD